MDHKTFSTHLIKADQAQGVVESIIAVMGNDDLGGDVIHPGAFTKSIQERLGKIRVLDQHQTDSVMRVIGKPIEMREVGRDKLPPDLLMKYPNATGGLYAKTQYLVNTPEGKGVFDRIASGAIDEYSIGYDPMDVDYSKLRKADGTEKTVRNLRTIKLYEYSSVLWGMNEATTTLSAKGATGAAGLPLGDRARAWDSTAAQSRVRTWADATDAPNAKYREAFFWYDASAPDNFTSYKLQFADVVDGKLTAIPRGIFAVAAVLQGSRGGVDIPAGDKETIKGKVSAYYAKMRKEFDDDSIVAPWDSKSLKEAKPWNVFHEGDKWNVYKLDADGNPTGDRLGSFDTEGEARAQVRALYASENAKSIKSVDLTTYVQEVTEAFNEQFGMGDMSNMVQMGGECFCIWRVYDDHVVVCEMMSDDYYSVDYSAANGEFVFANKPDWVEGDLQFVAETMPATGEMKRYAARPDPQTMSATRAFTLKAGRVLAARNETRLRDALKLITEALAELDKADITDEAPVKRAAKSDAPAQAGPTSNTSPTDEALRASIEIELAELKLMEV